jgi:alkylation response protein AidB-like acyl-CoA dehydrogenase
MRFGTTENQQMIAEMLKSFGEQNIRPDMMDWDEKQTFPVELFRKLGELGCMGVLVPEKYGGAGFGYSEYVTTIVEISKICGSIGLSVAAHNSLCTNHILMFGNDDQKDKYLPKLASGEHIGAWGLTEPNTGSDAGNMKTTAVRDGDNWVLNGSKNFITHGISGEIAVVMTRTGPPRTKNNSTAFIVERGTKGFSGGKKRG